MSVLVLADALLMGHVQTLNCYQNQKGTIWRLIHPWWYVSYSSNSRPTKCYSFAFIKKFWLLTHVFTHKMLSQQYSLVECPKHKTYLTQPLPKILESFTKHFGSIINKTIKWLTKVNYRSKNTHPSHFQGTQNCLFCDSLFTFISIHV